MDRLTTTIAKAINRGTENGCEYGKGYYLTVLAAHDGGILVTPLFTGTPIEYQNAHGFMKEWQDISSLGYANTNVDLERLIRDVVPLNEFQGSRF